jgi:hypothetical protein
MYKKMELIHYSKRESNIFEILDKKPSLKDDIIFKNIKLYNEEYLQTSNVWGLMIKEDKIIRDKRESMIHSIIQFTDEFGFSFDTCEIAIQFMDIFFSKKIKNEKDTSKYELSFMKERFEEWIDKREEIALFLSVIISLSGKYQELQKDSNIAIKGVDKKKMGKGEYEIMDYFEYLVPYKTPSFFIHLLIDDFYNPEKILFYTYRIIDDLFKYSDYIIEKHTFIAFSILKCVIKDIFKQLFLISLWEDKVKRYISKEDDIIFIEKIYKKVQYIVNHSDGYIESLHKEYHLSKGSLPIENVSSPLVGDGLLGPLSHPQGVAYNIENSLLVNSVRSSDRTLENRFDDSVSTVGMDVRVSTLVDTVSKKNMLSGEVENLLFINTFRPHKEEDSMTEYITPKNIKIRFMVKVGEWELPVLPFKKQKI